MKKIAIILLCVIAFSARGQKISLFDSLMTEHKSILESIQNSITEDLDSVRIKGFINLTCPTSFFIGTHEIYEDYQKYTIKLFYTETHRQRILEVLNNEWPEWELETMIQNSLTYRTKFEKSDAEEITKTDTSRTVDVILDSLLKSRYEELRNKYKNETKWRITYANLASFINDPRFVEPIKKAYSEDTVFYGYCLARMGVEPYLSNEEAKLIAKLNGDIYSAHFFDDNKIKRMPRTQAIFKQVSEYLLYDYTYDFLGTDDRFHFARVADVLFHILANEEIADLYSPEERKMFNYPSVACYLEFTKEHAKRLYDWMQENYGNYKIRPF